MSSILCWEKVDGCTTEIVDASLLLAENASHRIEGPTVDLLDMQRRQDEALLKIKAEREAEAAARSEEARRVAEAQAKKAATETARQQRLAAERKKKQAEEEEIYAKKKAAEDAKAAEEQKRLRAACKTIYQTTVDKKLKDLTVREEEQIRACQALGLYQSQ